jgi:hypothetical protein
MSATLYALVVLQGTTLVFSPGYASPTECYAVYKGPFISCFAYDPDGSSWTAFFKLPDGGFRTAGRINSEDECKRYIGAFRAEVPAACRQLAIPSSCSEACRLSEPRPKPVQPEHTPPPVPEPQSAPEPKPDPVQIKDIHEPSFSNRPIVVASVSAPARPRVVRRNGAQPQFDPIAALVALFTPRD